MKLRSFFRLMAIPVMMAVSSTSHSQEILDIVFVGDNRITKDPAAAKNFVVISAAGNRFAREDYKMRGALQRVRTYSDSAMKVLDGQYLEYRPTGYIHYRGLYVAGLKDGTWFTFNDTGRVIRSQTYVAGAISESKEVDPTEKPKEDDAPGERSAEMKGGTKTWIKYLTKRLEKTDAASKAFSSGTVRVAFTIDTLGATTDIFLVKSAEFILHQEGMDVIRRSPAWIPAMSEYRLVKAYRVQPLTFIQ